MVGLFPTQAVVSQSFLPTSPFYKPTPSPAPHPQKRPLFSAWSAADTVKDKAHQLSAEAQREYEVASQKAQAKAGKIELYSGKYYAACVVGGILACVSTLILKCCLWLIWRRVQPIRLLHPSIL